jgi:hypothetical protein
MTEYIVQVRRIDPVLSQLTGVPLTYAYGSPLWPGDRVMCPSTPYSGGPFIAEVAALGRGGFDGDPRQILCRVAPDRRRGYAGNPPRKPT